MKRVRTVLFWAHLTAGVAAGVVILVMSFTGVVLALRPQIQDWVDRDAREVTPRAAPRLGAQQLLVAVLAARPGTSPQSLTIEREATTAAVVNLGPEGNVYVDPYTGAILGTGSTRTSRFFQTMTNWHRYLGGTGQYRAAGRAATGVSNFAFLVLAMSGVYLWWPRQLTRQYLAPIVWFRRTSTGRARDFNWHNTIGFWCAIPIVIMTISGVVMSYSWANDLVYRLTGSPVPVRGAGPGGPPPVVEGAAAEGRGDQAAGGARGREAGRPDRQAAQRAQQPTRQRVPPASVIPETLDGLWARAEQQVPTWSVLSMRLPNRGGAPITFTITDGANWNAFARSNLTLNSATTDVVRWQRYEDNNLGQKVRGWLRFAHTGELGGLPGQVVAGLGCLGGVFLVCTGLSLAFRRLWNWKLWKRPSPASPRVVSGVRAAAPAPVARDAVME